MVPLKTKTNLTHRVTHKNPRSRMDLSWDGLIADASMQLQAAEMRVHQLKMAIHNFREQMKKGSILPGSNEKRKK